MPIYFHLPFFLDWFDWFHSTTIIIIIFQPPLPAAPPAARRGDTPPLFHHSIRHATTTERIIMPAAELLQGEEDTPDTPANTEPHTQPHNTSHYEPWPFILMKKTLWPCCYVIVYTRVIDDAAELFLFTCFLSLLRWDESAALMENYSSSLSRSFIMFSFIFTELFHY